MIKRFTLKNGINVSYYFIPQMRAVYLSLAVKSGYTFDPKNEAGVAHFMEHILVEAIPSFPNVESLSEFIESFAGSYSASTGFESIHFRAGMPSTHLEDMLKVAGEVFFEPLFRDQDIEREKGAITEEIHLNHDDIRYKNHKFWTKNRFRKGHSLLRDGLGSEETVKRINKRNLVNYWSKFFHPKNTYLALVGNLPIKNIKSILNNTFSKYDSGISFPGYPKFTNEDFLKRKIAIRSEDKLKSCYIDLSFPSLSNSDPISDRVNQIIILYILANMRKSRLLKILRHQKGLVYYVNAYDGIHSSFGYVDIYSQAQSSKTQEVITLIIQELLNIYKSGPTKQELDIAKNYYSNQILMSFDNPASISSWIESNLLWDDKIYTPEDFCKIIDKIDPQSIMEIMKKYWDLSKINLTIQGSIKNSAKNIKIYENLLEVLNG